MNRHAGSAADVVVVGGGSCGSVLAARLAQDPARSVTLIEAGASYLEKWDWPSSIRDAYRMPADPGSRWVQTFATELSPGRSAALVRGRVVGGSGAINGCYFVRALPSDFAELSRIAGSPLWSYDSVLPYFRASESDRDFDGPVHGGGGPMPVQRTRPADLTRVSSEFRAVAIERGFADVADLNDSTGDGVGLVPLNVDDGVRVNAAMAYLRRRPSNLTVLAGAAAHRVVFDRGTVIGVEIAAGVATRVLPAQTVVLAAGAIGSAELLLRSGVGPADDIRRAGIPVVCDRPGVGASFADHPETAVPYRYTATGAPQLDAVAVQVALHHGALEIRAYTHPLSHLIPGAGAEPYLGVALMRPESRGRMWLDERGGLRIEHRYLTEGSDRSGLRDGMRLAADLLDGLKERGVIEEHRAVGDDGFVAAHLGTAQHLTGTCSMGPASDPNAVVDERCWVHGVSGLGIADLSIVPVPLSRGPHATAIMLAERAAVLFATPIRG
ncbi:mycofactocin system GMC family oxidoreductase MftG [Skermania sp. ID1734]|nr:mycofactocin system GMC family oxidoreductase MftG [Skermania sp. ID1734]